MAATINTNIASINAQRNLAMSGQSLTTTMQRLSSGLRVNSAKDDAAGLAISERMNTQVRGLTVASRNANDGISLAQTAEGALGKVGDMLQRMRELAVQASNATNSESDRSALQAEMSQLSAEIDRVAKQTNFNGQKILDGSFAGAVFQVGANSGDNVTLGSLVDTRTSQISTISYGVNRIPQDPTQASSVDDYINTAELDSSGTDNAMLSEYSLPAPVAYDPKDLDTLDDAFRIEILSNSNNQAASNELITTVHLPKLPAANSRQERLGQVVEAINNKSTDTGVTAFLTKKEGTEAYSIVVLSSKVDSEGLPVEVKFTNFTTENSGVPDGTIDIVVDTSDPDANTYNQQGVSDIDITTQEGAWLALKKIDSAIDQINSARATLGAMQTRFENAVNNIDIQIENLSAARGRIVDTDFAVETANLSRTQILQQAGTAMVAQANQIPQNVLQLLQS